MLPLVDCYQNSTTMYLVTDLGGSDLFEFLFENSKGVPETWARSICYHLIRATNYLHTLKYAHRDIKPENILIIFNKESGEVEDLKLCDFGLAAFCDETPLTEFCGSPGFYSPEMACLGGYNGYINDSWSIGCVLLELILGSNVFNDLWLSVYDYINDKERASIFKTELEKICKLLPAILLREASQEFVDLMMGFLTIDPLSRKLISDLSDFSFLSKFPPLFHSKSPTFSSSDSTASVTSTLSVVEPYFPSTF